MRRLLPLLLLAACEPSPEEQADLGRDLARDYAQAACRFYTDAACIENQTETCGGAMSFETMADCTSFFSFAFAMCDDGVYAALWEEEDLVLDCVAEIEAVDCVDGAICAEDGTSVFDTGACGELDLILQGFCDQGDSGA